MYVPTRSPETAETATPCTAPRERSPADGWLSTVATVLVFGSVVAYLLAVPTAAVAFLVITAGFAGIALLTTLAVRGWLALADRLDRIGRVRTRARPDDRCDRTADDDRSEPVSAD